MSLATFLTQPTPFRLLIVLIAIMSAVAVYLILLAALDAIEESAPLRVAARVENETLAAVGTCIVLALAATYLGSHL